ncbi:MAG: tetratricopeptide repeat protein [Planctomycetes bacterium]|nr:tetratricopeptide repeat protein [Planctomycetota bacterium]
MIKYNTNQKTAVILLFLVALGFIVFNGHTPSFSEAKPQEGQQESDLDFADRLAEESTPGGLNFLDIAEEMAQDILKNTASKKVQQHATLVLGKIKKFSSTMERDPEKRAQLMNESVDILTKFIQENADYSGISEAKFELSELLQGKAIFLSNVAKVEADPAKKQGLIEQVEATYIRINEDLNSMIGEYQKTLDGTSAEDKREELDNKIMRASYTLAQNFYLRGMLYNKGDENNKKYIQESIKSFNTFALKYGDKLLCYEAADYIGECYYELDNYRDAKTYYKMTANLYKTIKDDEEKTPEEKTDIINECQDIIQRGYAHLAKAANATRDYAEAIKTIDELIKIYPKGQSEQGMETGLLEKAYALFATNNKDKALAIVQDIKDNSKNSASRSAANDALNKIIKTDVNVPPVIVIATMRDLLAKSKYSELILQGQVLMARLSNSSEAETVQYLPEALLIMAESYKTQERFCEAIILYETVYLNPKYKDAKSTQKEDLAPLAAYGAASSYLSMGAATGDEADKAKYKESFAYLTKTWPDNDIVKSIKYFQAKEYEGENRYFDAAKAYEQVPASNKYYYDSLFRIGRMYHLQSDNILAPSYRKEKDAKKKDEIKNEILRAFASAEESYKKALKLYEEKSKEALDEESKNKIAHNELQTRIFLSRMYLSEFLGKYSEVLAILSGLEKKYASKADAVREILQLKIEAYINMNELDNAEAHFKSLQEYARKDNNPEITAPAMQMMALAYVKKADSIVPQPESSTPEGRRKRADAIREKKEKSAEEYKKFADALQRAGSYFSQWVELRKKTITPDEVLSVAENLLQFAEEIGKNDFYTKAIDLYERILSKEFQGKLPRQEAWLIKWRLARALRALGEKDKAVTILESLDAEKKNNVDIIKELALAYEAAGSKDNQTPWQSARKTWARLGGLLKSGTEEWWETKYHFVTIEYWLGNFKEALYAMKMIEQGVSPDYDNNKWGYKDKFSELKKKVEAK